MQKRLPHRHPLLPPIAEMPLPPKPVMCSAFAAVAGGAHRRPAKLLTEADGPSRGSTT